MAEREIPLEQPLEFKPVVVPDNVYDARVKEVRTNVHPQFGESLIIDFEIISGSHIGTIIGGFASLKKLTKKTKLWRWAKNLNAPVPEVIGQTFNPNSLIGKVGRILTQQQQRLNREGKTFLNSSVKDVLGPPVSGGQSSSQPIIPVPSTTGTHWLDHQSTPLPPQSIIEDTMNKMDSLRNFVGVDFTESDLQKLGFGLEEIQFLKTHGYIYEPKQGTLRLMGD